MTLESIMEFYNVEHYHYNFVTGTLEIYEDLPVKYFTDIKTALRQIEFRLNNIIVETKYEKEKQKVSLQEKIAISEEEWFARASSRKKGNKESN